MSVVLFNVLLFRDGTLRAGGQNVQLVNRLTKSACQGDFRHIVRYQSWAHAEIGASSPRRRHRHWSRSLGSTAWLLAPLRGQAGRAYLANKVASQCYDGQVVLAVVDLDKVGDNISNSAQERLEVFATKRRQRIRLPQHRRQRTVTLDWRVIALTDEQVDQYGIVRVPRVDGREKDGAVRMVAETEALGATNLRAIVRAELEACCRSRSLSSVVANSGSGRRFASSSVPDRSRHDLPHLVVGETIGMRSGVRADHVQARPSGDPHQAQLGT